MERIYIKNLEQLRLPHGFEWVKKFYKYVPAKVRVGNTYKVMEMPVFEEPVMFCDLRTREELSLVPISPRYAVTKDGRVYDIFKSKYIVPARSKGYTTYAIEVPDRKDGSLLTYAHRLVALSWLKNNDYVNKPVVDHIDSDKTNNHIGNLRWVSFEYNNSKDVNAKNLKDGKYIIYDIFGRNVLTFDNLNGVAKLLGKSKPTISGKKFPTLEFNKETKKLYYLTDRVDDTFENLIRKGLDAVTLDAGLIVRNRKTKSYEYYPSKRKFWKEKYGKNLESYKLERLLNLLERDPVYELVKYAENDGVKNVVMEAYKVKNINTGEIKEFKSKNALKKFLKIGTSTLDKILRDDKCYKVKDWIFWKNGKWCNDDLIPVAKSKRVKVIYKDGREEVYNSIREASRALEIDQSHILYKRDIPYPVPQKRPDIYMFTDADE